MRDDQAAMRVLRWVSRLRWLLLGVVLLLPLLSFNGQWRANADSAGLLSVARQLRNTGSTVTPMGWEQNVNPVAVRVLALLGEDPILPAMLLWLLPVYAGLMACYGIARAAGIGPAAATLITFAVGINARYLALGATLLLDIWFAAGLWLMMWGVVFWGRRPKAISAVNIKAIGLCVTGLALMASTRSVVVVVLGAAVVAGVWEAWRRGRYGVVTACACLFAIVAALGWFTPSAREDVLLLFKVLTIEQGARTSVNLHRMFIVDLAEGVLGVDMTPWVSPVLAVFLIAAGLAWWCRGKATCGGAWWLSWWGWLWLAFLVQWVLFLPDVRYVVPALPVLVWGGWRLLVWLNKRLGEPWGGYVLFAGLAIYATPNLIKTIDLVREQRSTPFVELYRNGDYEPVFAAGDYIKQHTPAGSVVLTSAHEAPELTWLADRWVMTRIDATAAESARVFLLGEPDEPLAEDLRQHGWSVGRALFDQAGQAWVLYELQRP